MIFLQPHSYELFCVDLFLKTQRKSHMESDKMKKTV